MTVNDLVQLLTVFAVAFVLPIVPVLPIRPSLLVPLVAANVDPYAVAAVASLGAALGTLPLYAVAATTRNAERVKRWLQRRWVRGALAWLTGKTFFTIFVFALLPLPDQLMSVATGVQQYPARKVVLAFFLGRFPVFLLYALIGSANREWITANWLKFLDAFRW